MSEAHNRATRRTLLRGGLVAGLAGVAGLVGLSDQLKPAGTSSSTTLTLHGSAWRLTAPGLNRGELPKRGDLVTVTGTLTVDGAPEAGGEFVGSALHLDVNTGNGPFASAQQETHTFHLADGTIVGMGTSLREREAVYAIVGGTGRYAGVSGTYVATQSPLEIGGDGSAKFIFTFNSRR